MIVRDERMALLVKDRTPAIGQLDCQHVAVAQWLQSRCLINNHAWVRVPPATLNQANEEFVMRVEIRPGEGGDDAYSFAQECL